MTVKEKIKNGKTSLGIELGSTRIKAVLTDDTFSPIADGSHTWENKLENGFWTYSLDDIHSGLQSCYRVLKENIREKYGVIPTRFGSLGISAMMHGIMPFDKNNNLLSPFRTWRNTTAEKAARELTELFRFNIPNRWTISHLYEMILDNEPFVGDISRISTLAAYIHFLLTDRFEAGIGEASGMFPVNDGDYNKEFVSLMNDKLKEKGFKKDITEILPEVRLAGEKGAFLTESGAKLLDPDGDLRAGIPVCPPEGDAGTGMTATNAVLPGKGNISAGTSIFGMLTLDKQLKGVYPEIDIVATPDGIPCAMVHCNNCTSEINAWVNVFDELLNCAGNNIDKPSLYKMLFKKAMEGDPDAGGVTVYNFLSAEPAAKADIGRPMYFRAPDGNMNLANFMRAQIYGSVAALKIGMDILFEKENAKAGEFTGHGGLFKTPDTASVLMANALDTPVSVMKTAGEGGAWGMALLAAFMLDGNGKPLPDWLNEKVFPSLEKHTSYPDEEGIRGFEKFMERYKANLPAERLLN